MGVPASAGRPRYSSPQWLPPAPPEEPEVSPGRPRDIFSQDVLVCPRVSSRMDMPERLPREVPGRHHWPESTLKMWRSRYPQTNSTYKTLVSFCEWQLQWKCAQCVFCCCFALIAPSILLVSMVLSCGMQLLLSPLVHLSARQKCLLLVGG